jgi:hypothetical protein
MCHGVCFEAGRLTQTQSSWTAPCCSRKWMSGHADALAQSATDRKRQVGAQLAETANWRFTRKKARKLFRYKKPRASG